MKFAHTTGAIDHAFIDFLKDIEVQDLSDPKFFEERIAPWIAENVDPEMVFEEGTLCAWARNQDVEDVCETSDLDAWAEENGYVKTDD